MNSFIFRKGVWINCKDLQTISMHIKKSQSIRISELVAIGTQIFSFLCLLLLQNLTLRNIDVETKSFIEF